MIATMLALPILLSACGKSEWREVKAPEAAAVAKPAAAPLAVPEAAPVAAPPVKVAMAVPPRPRPAILPITRLEAVPAPVAAPVTPVERAIPPKAQAPEPVKALAPAKVAPVKVAPVKPAPIKTVAVAAPKPAPEAPKSAPVVHQNLGEADRYIMIQNIATEKMRVYERSTVAGQPHRLIFETNLIAGENDPAKTRRTALGSYKIEKWIKFYQDNQGLFPSWWDATLTYIPLPGSTLQDWTQPSLMPKIDGIPSGLVRGAFGWYTAKIGPNAFAQWTHGTVGWGADQDAFIAISKTQLAQFYSDPRSYGCTRVENRAIAYIQNLLPVGTRVVKVYAAETLADKSLVRYKNQAQETFEFALTNDEVRVENPNSAERAKQVLRQVSEDAVLETGSYKIDATPNAVPFKKTIGTRNVVNVVNNEANLYDIPEKSFQGEFLVDEGRFVNYKHPRELRVGGFKDQALPAVVLK